MIFALVNDGQIHDVGRLPGSARILATREWFCPPGGLADLAVTVEEREACGWFPVTDTPPTYDTATEVLERGDVMLVDGLPVREYTVRAKTQGELDADAQAAQDQTEREQAKQAYDTLGEYIALDSPTAAQTVAVVKLLCRVAIRLIRDQYGR